MPAYRSRSSFARHALARAVVRVAAGVVLLGAAACGSPSATPAEESADAGNTSRSDAQGSMRRTVDDASDAVRSTAHRDGGVAEAGGGVDAGDDPNVCGAVATFAATATSSSEIDLGWTPEPGVTYELRRETYCGSDAYATLARLPAGTSRYADTSVEANYVYWYELIATGAAGETAQGAVAAQAATDGQATCGTNGGRSSGVTSGTCAASGGDAARPDAVTGDGGGADSAPAVDGGAYSGCPALPAITGPIVQASSTDDIQSLLNGAASGSQIVFAVGTYTFSSTLTVPSNLTLVGQAGVVFNYTGASSSPTLLIDNGTSVRVDGITFNGSTSDEYQGTITVSGTGITLTNNTFQSGSSQIHIYSGGMTGSLVAKNTINGAANIGLLAYALQDTQISCNTFVDNDEELHLFFGNSSPTVIDNVSVDHNVFVQAHRYIMEIQGGPNTLTVNHNWGGNWEDSEIEGSCLSTSFSIATGGGSAGNDSLNVTVHDNAVAAPPSGALSSIGSGCGGITSPYELMGSNLAGWNNYEWGAWEGGPLVGFTTPAWTWKNNVKIGSGLSSYPGPSGENGYEAPAPGNYAGNLVEDAGTLAQPEPSWAFTTAPP